MRPYFDQQDGTAPFMAEPPGLADRRDILLCAHRGIKFLEVALPPRCQAALDQRPDQFAQFVRDSF